MRNDAIVCNVFQTTDYSKFNYLKGNRKINLHNLNRLRESLSERQLISTIIVNDKYQIIDGQHRFEACKELGLPVYYVVANGYGLHEVQVLNTNASNWTKKEYLNSYCDLGYDDYLKMREFMGMFPDFSLTTCYAMLTQLSNQGGRVKTFTVNGVKKTTSAKDFEKGKFKIKDWGFAIKSAEKLMMIKPFYDGFNRKSFVLAMLIQVFVFKTYGAVPL
jgi:hypothetical protein